VRTSNRRLMNALVVTLADSEGEYPSGDSLNITTLLPADVQVAEEKVRSCEHEWREAGAVRVSDQEVDQALQKANGLESEFNRAKVRCLSGLDLLYLKLVRVFVITGLPRLGVGIVIGASTAIICALFMLIAPFVFSPVRSVFERAFLLAVMGFSLATAVVTLLWPTETYQRLEREWKERKDVLETWRLSLLRACAEYQIMLKHWTLYARLKKARQRRDDIAALLTSAKYQLIHSDWRSLRDVDFERFLFRVFETLGYHVELTKKSGDQGADLLVTGKGEKIAVQTKGYADSVGNGAVQEIVAAMPFYHCTSCVVITNSRFTRHAQDLARANGCRLIAGEQIPDLIEGRIY
jgi:HJR/Mrr/RecB family endonuclease